MGRTKRGSFYAAFGKSGIARRLVVAVVLFSTCITVVTTSIQLYMDYRRDINQIHNIFGLIRSSYLKSLSNSVWMYDDPQITMQLEGLLKLPDVEYLEIKGEGSHIWRSGSLHSKHFINTAFPLLHTYEGAERPIGVLTATASLDNVYDRLIDKGITILVTNGIKTFFVAGFMLLIFQFMVTQHLKALADHVGKINLDEAPVLFSIKRKKRNGKSDELEQVARAVNEMQIGLHNSYEDLKNSAIKYRELVQNANSAIIRITVNGEVTFINEYAISLFGFQADEIIGKNIVGTIVPVFDSEGNDQSSVIAEMFSGDSKHKYFQAQNVTKQGRKPWLSWSARKIVDAGGNVGEILCVGIDITRRKKAEEDLAEIFALSVDPICIIDLGKDTLLRVNPALSEILGYPREELLSKSCFDFIHRDDVAATRSVFEKKLKKGENLINFENRVRCRDGSYRWFNWTSHPVHEKGIAYCVARDETERRKSLIELREAHERFLTVLNAIDAHVCVVDITSHEILFANESMKKDYGRNLVGEQYWAALPNQDAPYDHRTNGGLLDDAGELTDLYVWQEQNPITGRWFTNHDRAITWIDGRLVRLRIAMDINDIKQMEEDLRQAHKMEAIGTLAGGVAHDFNNILSIILGNTELALDNIQGRGPAKDNLEEISTACLRARDVVRQLLSYSRKTEATRKPMDINGALKESFGLIRASLPAHVEIRQELAREAPYISGDSTQISQIVINLCSNAADAMQNGGGILEIKTDPVQFTRKHEDTGLEPGRYVKLTVRDSGEGIPEEALGRIFDPYFTTKEVGKGTGMGLAVVHGIVEEHKGKTAVQSTPGKGTTFEIFFPAVEAEAEPETRPDEALPTGKERILLVDDEESLVMLNRMRLQRLGYSVHGATDPREALKQFRSDPGQFDLIITDMTMPSMMGDQLAREVMKIRRECPVILCTGYSELISEEEAKDMGVRAFVLKPLEMRDLAKTVRNVLDESKPSH